MRLAQSWIVGGLAGLLAFNTYAAQPTYEQANRLLRDMEDVVAATGGWSRKPLPARIESLRRAERLVDQAKSTFGDSPVGQFGACWAAANGMRSYVSNLNDLALIAEGKKTAPLPADYFAPPFLAFGFGRDHQACRQLVEAIPSGKAGAK